MHYILYFVVYVAAGTVLICVRKWIDKNDRDN